MSEKTFHCSSCGMAHDVSDSEVSYKLPDDFASVPENKRSSHGKADDNFCQFRDRWFIRALAPVPVPENDDVYCWGIWVEVSQADFFNVFDTWKDEDVSNHPRILGKLANAVFEYPDSIGLVGEIELRSETRPFFFLLEDSKFKREQNSGVTIADLVRYYHHAT